VTALVERRTPSHATLHSLNLADRRRGGHWPACRPTRWRWPDGDDKDGEVGDDAKLSHLDRATTYTVTVVAVNGAGARRRRSPCRGRA